MQKEKVRIRMNRSFTNFSEEEKSKFITDLANLTGVLVDDISEVLYRKGCVIFEGKLDAHAVQKLVREYKKYKNTTIEPSNSELKDFIEQHSVVLVSDDLKVVQKLNIQKYKPTKILFVHGFIGDEGTFGKMPEFLSEELQVESLAYTYPTGIVKQSPSLFTLANSMDNWIRNNEIVQNMVVIAHSMGGVLTRQMLVNDLLYDDDDQISSFIKSISFIASPYTGASFAKVANFLPIRRKQLQALDPDSDYLLNLNPQWEKWLKGFPSKHHIRSIYAENDSIVTKISAAGRDLRPIPILGEGHRSIVKPKTKDDEIVTTLVRLIKESLK